MLRILAAVVALLATAALAAPTHGDDGEAPPPPVVDTWPGKEVCGGDEPLGDTVCYTVPDVACRTVNGVVEDCTDRRPGKKPDERPPGPEAPEP